MWVSALTRLPASRETAYSSTNQAVPSRRSTSTPQASRHHMLNSRCRMEKCRKPAETSRHHSPSGSAPFHIAPKRNIVRPFGVSEPSNRTMAA